MNEYGEKVAKKMSDYMGNTNSVDQEINDIQSAIEGVEVRGALAAGVKKSFDKSKESESKANEAHDVMESIMNEGFDNAALEANFEQKLDDKIANLQPEWTQFQEDTETQLAETAQVGFKQSLVNHKGNTAKVLWIDDDGHKGVYTKLAPLLREYGIVMSAGIITNRPHGFPIAGLPAYDPNSRFMSYEQMKELEYEGIVEFIPHSHTHDINHRLTDMTVEEMHEELSTCKDIFIKLGWNYRDFVYPFGAENEQVHEVTRQYFRSAIDIGGGIVIPPFNQFKIPRVAVDGDRTAQEVIDQIDDAIDLNTLAILTTHVDQYGGLDEQKMRDIIEHVQSRGVEFVTASEAINEFGNLLQIGKSSIDSKGNIYGGVLGVYRYGHLDYPPNAPITEFEKGTVTKLKVRTFDLSGYKIINDTRLPNLGYGYIYVHRDLTEDSFSYQIFDNIYTNKTIIRKWDNNQGDWGKWEDYANKLYLKNQELGQNPSKYDDLKETIEKVTNANSSSYLSDVGGIVNTYKDTERNFSYQTLVPMGTMKDNSGILLRNGLVDEDKWGNWYSIPTSGARYLRYFNNLIVPANSTVDRVTIYESVSKEAFYVSRIAEPLPSGIDVNVYCWEDGELVIRVSNCTNNSVTIPRLEIVIRKMVI